MKKGVRFASGSLLACLAAWAQPAVAQIDASLDGSARYEDNLFRTSRVASDEYGLTRSDRVYTAQGEADVKSDFGSQTADVHLEFGHDWYDRNSNLSNNHYLASVDLERPVAGVLGYSLTASAAQNLTPFSDLGLPVRNLQQLQQISGEADLAITPNLRVVFTPSAVRSVNGNVTFRPSDYWQGGGGIGLGYFSPLGNSVAVTVSRSYTQGLHDRPTTIGTSIVNAPLDLVDTSADLRLKYSPSVITEISGILSYISRNDKSIFNSNYKGLTGSLAISYHPRDSLELTLRAGRRLETQSFVFVEAIRNDYANLAATLTLPDTTKIGARFEFQHRDLGNGEQTVVGTETGKDHSFLAGLTAQRLFFERVRLNLGVSHEWRTANDAFFSYRATVAEIGLAFVFGQTRR